MKMNNIIYLLLFISGFVCAEEVIKQCPFAAKAAEFTDHLIIKSEEQPSLIKPFTSIGARAISLTMFPLGTAADLVYHSGGKLKETGQALISKSATNRQKHQQKSQQNTEAIKRSLLGLIASPTAVISPDLVSHHFLIDKTPAEKIAPYGKLYSIYAHELYPESIEEVQRIVLEAQLTDKTVSIIGAGMSQGKQALSNEDWNVIINTSNLNWIEIDPQHKTAKVGSGTTWGDLQNAANEYGLAVRVMQASNIFSVGGSLSVNCHGWDIKTGSLRNTVNSVTIVNAMGEVQTLTRADDLFNYVIGGYGGFGVIVEAELSLTDNIELLETGEELLTQDYPSYFWQYIHNNPDVDMHLFRLSLDPKKLFQSGIAVNYVKVGDEPLVAYLKDEPNRGNRLDRIKLHLVRRLKWIRNFAWKSEKKEALEEKIATRNEFMRPPINPVFNGSKHDVEWLQEYFVSSEELPNFLTFLAGVLRDNEVPVFNASVRFVKHDPETKLSYAKGGDRFAIVLFFNQKLSRKSVQKTRRWVREVLNYLVEHGGTYYLPYQHFATQGQFEASYPGFEQVRFVKGALDPDGVFDNGLYADYIHNDQVDESLFRKVFDKKNGQRKEIRDFLENVFMQFNEKKYFELVDQTLQDTSLTDDEIYEVLYSKIKKAKMNPLSDLRWKLRSLSELKTDLADQVKDLMDKDMEIDGYVEIGYTGRMVRPLKSRLTLTGPIYAVNDKELLTDYVEVMGTRPYDTFIPLNDYEPFTEEQIPSESVDLVACYIGLHHAPEEKLDAWLESIKRIIRPGGTFVLMDHDAYNQKMVDLVDVVHSIFNMGTGVSPKENKNEIRNFKPLQEWIELLNTHGFITSQKKPTMRKGDSTKNTLLAFYKPFETAEQLQASLGKNTKHRRAQMQTYLTAPEWQNVRAAQNYADFVEKYPSWKYPYFSEVGNYWKVFGSSWNAARKDNSFKDVALSEYNFMGLFIGSTMTLEYGLKGLATAPVKGFNKLIGRKPKMKSEESLQGPAGERVKSLKEYGQYIEHTPFYQYHYFEDIKDYWGSVGGTITEESPQGSAKNILLGTSMTAEYAAKGILSVPFSMIYTSEGIKEAETLHALIKDPYNRLEEIDDRIKLVQTHESLALKEVEIPRYMIFKDIISKISKDKSIEFVSIAGQKKIQVDIKTVKDAWREDVEGAELLYNIPVATDKAHKYFAYEVEIAKLCEVLRNFESQGCEVLYIHDF